jgi:ClpP class serine protease
MMVCAAVAVVEAEGALLTWLRERLWIASAGVASLVRRAVVGSIGVRFAGWFSSDGEKPAIDETREKPGSYSCCGDVYGDRSERLRENVQDEGVKYWIC